MPLKTQKHWFLKMKILFLRFSNIQINSVPLLNLIVDSKTAYSLINLE